MGDDDGRGYREDLASAHARIAALEAELAARDRGSAQDRARVTALEKRRDELARAGAPARVRRQALLAPLVLAVFCAVVAALIGGLGPGVLHASLAGGLLGAVFGGLHWLVTPPTVAENVAKLDRQIDEARRLARLEAEVLETRLALETASARVRVDAGPQGEAQEATETSEGPRRTTSRA